jgi:hypothetical protein
VQVSLSTSALRSFAETERSGRPAGMGNRGPCFPGIYCCCFAYRTKAAQDAGRTQTTPRPRSLVSRTRTACKSLSATSTQVSWDVYELVRQLGFSGTAWPPLAGRPTVFLVQSTPLYG